MGRYSPLEVRYKRVILKLSGEALAGQQGNGINYDVVLEICKYKNRSPNIGSTDGHRCRRRQLLAWPLQR